MSIVTKNIFHNLWGQIVPLVATLLAVKLIFSRLGGDALGVLFFVFTMSGVLAAAFELGICTTTTREIATHLEDEPSYVNDLIRSFSLLYWIVFILTALAVWLTAPMLVRDWLHLSSLSAGAAIYAVRVMGVCSLLSLPRVFYTSMFRGLQRMEFNNAIDAGAIVIQQLGAAISIFAGASLSGVANWFAISYVLWTLASIVIVVAFFPLSTLLPGLSISALRRNLRFSAHMAGVSALSVIHMQSDKLVVSKFLEATALGYYSVASRLVSRASMLCSSISSAAFPSLSALFVSDRFRAQKQYEQLHDLVCLSMLPMFAAIVFGSQPGFSMLFNRQVASVLFLPTLFLSIGSYLNATLLMPYIFSLAAGRPDIANRLNAVALFISLPLTVWLTYRYGLAGAGFSWIIYHVVVYFYGLPLICRECLAISPLRWYVRTGKVILLGTITYGGAWTVGSMVGPDTAILGVAFLAGTGVYLFGWYAMFGGLKRTITWNHRLIPWSRPEAR